MKSYSRLMSGFAILVVGAALAERAWGEDSHRANAPEGYSTAHSLEPGAKVVLVAETRLDPTTFPLNSFAGKYRIVRVDVENRTDDPIDLFSDKDQLSALAADGRIAGVLNLGEADKAAWDSLDEARRKRLAYPKMIGPKASASVYVFFPADKLTDLPTAFEWTISGGSRTFKITKPKPVRK